MCGIVGYIGEKDACPILINGLKRLEYRGYDSAGIALYNKENIGVFKKKGKVSALEEALQGKDTEGTIGIGHTRWATHGEPNDVNAHPHMSMNEKFVLIHNGIIENYNTLKTFLLSKGYKFKSETDTEVLVNWIEYVYMSENISAEKAIRSALAKVIGAFGLVIICKEEGDKLIATRRGSPLVVGVGDNEYFLASDATPIIEYTKRVMYLDDDDIVILTNDSLQLKNIHGNGNMTPLIHKLDMDVNDIDKGGFDHFMLKEIFEQPTAVLDTIRGRVAADGSSVRLGGIREVMPKLEKANRLIIIACGTSWHAGLVGEYLFEKYAKLPVEVEYASEFRYREPIITEDDVVLAITQSGETADTLAAIRMAKKAGATVLGICNVVGSSISRETDAGVYTYAGPEIGVASTKAFTSQITVLTMMTLMLAQRKGTIDEDTFQAMALGLRNMPDKIRLLLKQNDHIKELAEKYAEATNSLYLGRGIQFPVALEGALKLKEISYIHAEGYPAAEMKHGPIALIDEKLPVVFVAAKDVNYEKVVSNIQEVIARKGIVIAVVTEEDEQIKQMATHVIEVPETHDALTPLLSVIPLQLFSYHIAVKLGRNVDQPRNLAKSVTVE
ncbi:glutamine--fructose-6-phosphate transaminase (isomerizing) [Saccharicrinis sp. FJH2]|uniref:glutamine--fructose-6-phosphate transaminase (isomerizing) n=1 Tax=Saccharicrinis sp. FJH65 TaxID=3344659 RepID=UPI0035F3E7B1